MPNVNVRAHILLFLHVQYRLLLYADFNVSLVLTVRAKLYFSWFLLVESGTCKKSTKNEQNYQSLY